jgi:hypothetical protein
MVGLLAFLASLVLLLGLLGLAALRGRVVHALALLAVEDGPYCLLVGSEAGGDVEQLVGVDRRAPRYVGPYQITRRIGSLAYQLALPETMAGVHPVFQVS